MRHLILLLLLSGLFLFQGCHQSEPVDRMESRLDTISYCIGVLYGNKLHNDGLDSVKTSLLKKGMEDYLNEKSLFDADEAKHKVMDFYAILQEKALLSKYADNKEEGERFLEENARRKEVTVLPSGLQYEVIQSGNGEQPDSNDVVFVHYRGQLVNGSVFEENFGQKPVPLGVDRVIPGWTEALLRMHVGDHWKIYIPYQLGYGTEFRPNSPILPYSALVFEIELVDIKKEP